MTCRLIGSADSGIASATVTDTEYDAVSVVAGGTLTANSTYQAGLYSLQAATGGTSGVSYGEIDWGADDAIIYLMTKVMFPAVPSAITAFLAVTDSVPTQLFALRVNASGFWQVNCNANATVYTSTKGKPLANVLHRIEFFFDITNGQFTLKVDGVADADLTQTGLTLGVAQPRRLRLGVVEAQTNAPTRYIDNWIVNNSGWIGEGVVKALPMKGTDAGNWTVVDGGKADWECMNEKPWNSNATDMIKSSTGSQEDRMTVKSLGTTTTGPTIIGLLPMIRQRRGVAGSAASVTVNLRVAAADGTASAAMDSGSTTWKTFRGAIQETNPNTGVAWTLAGIASSILRLVKDAGANECDVNAAFVYVAFTNGEAANVAPSKEDSGTHRTIEGNAIGPTVAERYRRRGRVRHRNVFN